LRRIPTSKEDVFKSSDMSLIDKRRLMKFLQFAMGDWEAAILSRYPAIGDLLSSHFRLAGPLLNATMYGFMGCHSKEGAPETLRGTLVTFIPEDTVSALQRLGRFLTSSGRYGTSPFLVAQYGGLNEILQGFCRYVGSFIAAMTLRPDSVSAVHGGLYILGRSVEVTTKDAIHHLSLSSQDSEDALHFSADLVVAQQPLQSAATAPTAHGILISKAPIRLESTASTAVRHSDLDVPTDERAPEVQQAESGLIVFPPGENGSPVSCVMHGENIYSSPAGYCEFPATLTGSLIAGQT
jgi:RAB protein geranylgeranyltransferase component A